MGVNELKEQLGISEEAGVSIRHIAKLAMNENPKIFEIFRQGEEEVRIASLARWKHAFEWSGCVWKRGVKI